MAFYFSKAICGSHTSFSILGMGGCYVGQVTGWTWLVCICFNITIVLCFNLSLSLKNYRMAKALVTSLLSVLSEKLAGLMWPPQPRVHHATCTETTASRLSLHFMSRSALTTAKDKVRSVRWSPSTLQRPVREWTWEGFLESHKTFHVFEEDKDHESGFQRRNICFPTWEAETCRKTNLQKSLLKIGNWRKICNPFM